MNRSFRKMMFLLLATRGLAGMPTAIAQEVSMLKSISTYNARDTAEIMKIFRAGWALKDQHQDSAIWYYNQSLLKSRNTGFIDGIALNLFNIGLIELDRDNYEEALEQFHKSLSYAKRNKHFQNMPAGLYINIGQVHFRRSDYKLAAKYYDTALQENLITKSQSKNYSITYNYNVLSLIYLKLGQYEKALYYLGRGEEICRREGMLPSLTMIISTKMDVYIRQKDLDKAMQCFEEGMANTLIYDVQKDEMPVALHCSASEVMLLQGKPEAALKYLLSIKTVPIVNDNYNAVKKNYLFGKTYLQLGDYAMAERHLLDALGMARQKNIKDNLIDAYKTLAELYEQTGAYHKALKQHQIYHQLHDSLFSKEKVKDINELEIRYRTAEKDRKLAEVESSMLKEQTKNQWQKATIGIALLGILLLISILIFLRYRQMATMRHHAQQKQLDILRATINGAEAERLRVGQELHDGVSGFLSAIKMNLATLRAKRKDIVGEENFINTLQLTDEAADELRRTAHNLVPSSLSQNGIGKAVKDFCEQVSAAFGLPITVQESYPQLRLEAAKELVIYRIIQELVHNMVKHSAATNGLVALSWQENLLLIAVEDNGTGLGQKDHKGIGLENIRKRMALLKGTMELSSQPGEGTSVYLEFPL